MILPFLMVHAMEMTAMALISLPTILNNLATLITLIIGWYMQRNELIGIFYT